MGEQNQQRRRGSSGGVIGSPSSELVVCVVGATGSVARTRIFPALYRLYCSCLVGSGVAIRVVAVAKRKLDGASFNEIILPHLQAGGSKRDSFLGSCTYVSGDAQSAESMRSTAAAMKSPSTSAKKVVVNRLLFLAVPPSITVSCVRALQQALPAALNPEDGWTRYVVEKPYGRDLETSQKLTADLREHVSENALYRIAHYLGKEMVQNVLAMRFGNTILEPLFNRHYVQAVVISMKESATVAADRLAYFDDFGVVRDLIQNHLFQLLSLVAMEPPLSRSGKDIRDEKVKVLRCVREINPYNTVFGQYRDYNGSSGYGGSRTPTFATIAVYIDNDRWRGVPFILKAGKGMDERKCEVRIQFKDPAFRVFTDEPNASSMKRNEIVIRLQPQEQLSLKMMHKVPGLKTRVGVTQLDVKYDASLPNSYNPMPYERLMYDIIRGKTSSFVRADELEESWRALDPLINRYESDEMDNHRLHIYDVGSRGPAASDVLMRKIGYERQVDTDRGLLKKAGELGCITVRRTLQHEFRIDVARMVEIVGKFRREMRAGLCGEPSALKMLPSFVTRLPSGSDTGIYYALDLGGTNFRVSRFALEGSGVVNLTDERKFRVPMSAMQGPDASALFNFLADCIGELQSSQDSDPVYGFTFSFPTSQNAIDEGVLISWTKGFTTAGVEGENVVLLLQEAMKARGIRGRIVAVVNDTVGTLAARHVSDSRCLMGVILGTGTNAAYVELVENIKTLPQAVRDSFGHGAKMVINMENGAFGDRGKTLPMTSIDRDIDATSVNAGQQTFEKMVSGMYLGEITRRCLHRLMRARELWNGVENRKDVFDLISTPGNFKSFLMSEIDYDMTEELVLVRAIEENHLGIRNSSVQDRRLLKEMCSLVADRAARLTASVIAATVANMGDRAHGCTVGIDGSVYENHPSFRQRLVSALSQLGCNCTVVLSKDGSGRGAALVACGVEAMKRE